MKKKYNKTKEGLESNLKEKYQQAEISVSPAEVNPYEANPETAQPAETNCNIEENFSETVSLDDLTKPENVSENIYNNEPEKSSEKNIIQPEIIEADTVSLDDIQNAAQNTAQESPSAVSESVVESEITDAVAPSKARKVKETIMPRAMKRLTPSPVSPMTSLNLNHSYMEDDAADAEEYIEEFTEEYVESSEEFKSEESFSQEDIEKADKLINNRAAASDGESETKTDKGDEKDELDLMQLAQTFAQNLTGGSANAKDVPPADLEEIFSGSYTEPFQDLEDIPSDVVVPEVQPNVSLMPKEMNTSNLTAQDIREIIRDEISKQTANVVPKPQSGEDMREIIREIVKQATEIAPQNAFKLDISHGTLDMIAKSIAKKIAVKLNSYYKLNSTKQNVKLQQFRERTIELKEKNQALAEENRRLKLQLTETKETLSAYKPSLFGLFKFTGKKKR